jgi:hypothetical protein
MPFQQLPVEGEEEVVALDVDVVGDYEEEVVSHQQF